MKSDGGPAFPVTADVLTDWTGPTQQRMTGMSLRDWFAGQAIARSHMSMASDLARDCYKIADAMLAERSK